jgi:hypothetical protein
MSRQPNILTRATNTHLAQRHDIQFAKAHSTHLPREHDMQHSAGTCHTSLSGIQHTCSCASRHTSFLGITASSSGARTGPGSAVLESATSLTRHSFPVSLAGPGPRRVCYCRTEGLGSGRNLLRGPPSNRFEVVRELRMGELCGIVWCGVLYL